MKIARKFFLAMAIAFITASSVHAQILWLSSHSITNDLDVLTNGSYFDATQLQYFDTSSQTVNGVLFNAFNGSNTDGKITLTNAGEGSDSYYGPATLSASYQAILTNTAYQDAPNNGDVNIGGLTKGYTYQVQIWLGPLAGRQTVYSGVTPIELTGADYAVGDFVALSANEPFTFTAGTGSPYGEIYSISVREIDVPEPSTYALMFAGLALLGFCLRRKGASAK
jgi:hypothetical protein